MKRFQPILLTLIVLLAWTPGHASDSKMWNESYLHEQTGIIIPMEVAGIPIKELVDFKESDFDGTNVGVRLGDELTKADVYLYVDENLPGTRVDSDDPAEKFAPEIATVQSTQNFIRKMAAEGKIYHDIDIPDTVELEEFGKAEGLMAVASSLMTYRESKTEPDDFGYGQAKRESFIAVVLRGRWFVKIRHTFVLAPEEEVNELRRKERDAFLVEMRKLIFDPVIRKDALDAIGTLKVNPADKEAGGEVFAYAEASALIHITIASEWFPFMENDDFHGATTLLTSFIAGNVEAQLGDLEFRSHDLEGMERMLDAYEILEAAGECDADPKLDEWVEQMKTGTLVLPGVKKRGDAER